MTVLGLDFDVRAVHAVLVDDESSAATYHALPIADRRGSFYAARNVRRAFQDAPLELRDALFNGVWIAGIEEPYCRNRNTLRALLRVQGAILACLPKHLHVVWLTPHEWKRAALGEEHASASKEDVRAWVDDELAMDEGAFMSEHGPDWPQDAFDAYGLARAIRALNERGLERVLRAPEAAA